MGRRQKLPYELEQATGQICEEEEEKYDDDDDDDDDGGDWRIPCRLCMHA
jgi:hypothetical protein